MAFVVVLALVGCSADSSSSDKPSDDSTKSEVALGRTVIVSLPDNHRLSFVLPRRFSERFDCFADVLTDTSIEEAYLPPTDLRGEELSESELPSGYDDLAEWCLDQTALPFHRASVPNSLSSCESGFSVVDVHPKLDELPEYEDSPEYYTPLGDGSAGWLVGDLSPADGDECVEGEVQIPFSNGGRVDVTVSANPADISGEEFQAFVQSVTLDGVGP